MANPPNNIRGSDQIIFLTLEQLWFIWFFVGPGFVFGCCFFGVGVGSAIVVFFGVRCIRTLNGVLLLLLLYIFLLFNSGTVFLLFNGCVFLQTTVEEAYFPCFFWWPKIHFSPGDGYKNGEKRTTTKAICFILG